MQTTLGKEITKMAFKITDACINCGACAAGCPMQCIKAGETKHEIDPAVCISCGACAATCPVHAPVLDE